jgi:hypothetical protein
MRVGIDLDEVTYPFVEILGNWIHRQTDRPRSEMPPATTWAFYEEWGYSADEFLTFYRDGVDAGYIFAAGLPITGALPVLDDLRKNGHTIHLITNRFVGRRVQENTDRWLQKWAVPYDSLTYAEDKSVLNIDLHLDDKPSNVDALRETGCAAYVYDCGRDDQAGHPFLISSWWEFLSIVNATNV